MLGRGYKFSTQKYFSSILTNFVLIATTVMDEISLASIQFQSIYAPPSHPMISHRIPNSPERALSIPHTSLNPNHQLPNLHPPLSSTHTAYTYSNTHTTAQFPWTKSRQISLHAKHQASQSFSLETNQPQPHRVIGRTIRGEGRSFLKRGAQLAGIHVRFFPG